MTQRRSSHGLDILEAHVETTLRQRPHFARQNQALSTTRTAAEAQVLIRHRGGSVRLRMRREHEAHGVVLHMRGDRNLPDELLKLHQRRAIEHLAHVRLHAFGGARDDFGQLGGGGVADEQLEEETVELRFGQRIGAFLVDGILRGEHEERLGQFANLATRRDALFLHGFEHGGLCLRRGAVDFVGQHDVGEDRSALELERAPAIGRFHHHVRAENVGGHQVRRELDAVEGKLQHLAERADEQCLAQPRHAFQQHMAAGEDRGQRAFDNGVGSDHDLADLGAEGIPSLAERLDFSFSAHVSFGCRLKVAGCRFFGSGLPAGADAGVAGISLQVADEFRHTTGEFKGRIFQRVKAAAHGATTYSSLTLGGAKNPADQPKCADDTADHLNE